MAATFTAREPASVIEAPMQATVQESARTMLRSLRTLAARYADHQEVVAVCRKWMHRVAELERQASA